jgi:hypothetical protein
MSVCSRGTGDNGLEITWRSIKPEEGSGRGRGLNADPTTRDSAWIKASKSKRLDRGNRFIGERILRQRQGGSSSRRGRVAVQSGETPEREEPWTRLWDETSSRAAERRKPSRGCDRLRTDRSEDVEVFAHGRRPAVMSR